MNITLLVAFLAGLATFFSPCILPVIPGYLAVLSGGQRSQVLRRTLLFALGMMLVFTTLGVVIGWVGGAVVGIRDSLVWVLGIVLIIYGVHLVRPLPLKFLNFERRLDLGNSATDLGAVLLGGAFGIAWTPCSGAILGVILSQALLFNTSLAAPLLLVFALGTVVPMVALGALYQYFGRTLRLPASWARWYSPVVGVIIIVLGLSLMSGWVNYWRADLLSIWPNLEKGLLPVAR